jgi:hypothetical protein
MPKTKKSLQIYLIAYALPLALLGGCATRTPMDVGQVVVAPKVQLPQPPVIVQQTQPQPMGYFQQTLVDYFSASPVKPTP